MQSSETQVLQQVACKNRLIIVVSSKGHAHQSERLRQEGASPDGAPKPRVLPPTITTNADQGQLALINLGSHLHNRKDAPAPARAGQEAERQNWLNGMAAWRTKTR